MRRCRPGCNHLPIFLSTKWCDRRATRKGIWAPSGRQVFLVPCLFRLQNTYGAPACGLQGGQQAVTAESEASLPWTQELVDERKVRYVGLSECTADQLRRAHAITPVTVVEIEWSLWARENEVLMFQRL